MHTINGKRNVSLWYPVPLAMIDQVFVNGKTWVMAQAARFVSPEWLPWASALITIGVIMAAAPVIMMYLTWLERKVIARMQNRLGPTRVGTFGLLQPIADGIKMLTKEDIVPTGADGLLHGLAPMLAVIPALLMFAVLPFGRHMIATDLNVGLLMFLAVSSVGSLALFTGGWASRNKFSLIGAMRSGAQLISSELPLVLSAVLPVMATGSLSTVRIVEAQGGWGGMQWFLFTPWGFVGFIIFFIAGVAEVNRTPFDIPEAESEIVAGFHTEYSGMKFALFYMGEFLATFAISGLAVTLFLGGWQGPAWLPLPSWLWFLLKTYTLVFVMIWLRATFPRLRVDQLMGLAWKFLLPMALVDVLAIGLWYFLPFPLGTLASTALLVLAAWALIKLNAPARLAPRHYRYAES